MTTEDDWVEKLKQARDEMRLHLHLAGKEARDEWDGILRDWDAFAQKAQLEKSADEVGDAARALGLKLKEAFERLRDAKD